MPADPDLRAGGGLCRENARRPRNYTSPAKESRRKDVQETILTSIGARDLGGGSQVKRKRKLRGLNKGPARKPISHLERQKLVQELASAEMPAKVVVPRYLRSLKQRLLRLRDLGFDALGQNDGSIRWTTSNQRDVNSYGGGTGSIPHIGVVKKRKG